MHTASSSLREKRSGEPFSRFSRSLDTQSVHERLTLCILERFSLAGLNREAREPPRGAARARNAWIYGIRPGICRECFRDLCLTAGSAIYYVALEF